MPATITIEDFYGTKRKRKDISVEEFYGPAPTEELPPVAIQPAATVPAPAVAPPAPTAPQAASAPDLFPGVTYVPAKPQLPRLESAAGVEQLGLPPAGAFGDVSDEERKAMIEGGKRREELSKLRPSLLPKAAVVGAADLAARIVRGADIYGQEPPITVPFQELKELGMTIEEARKAPPEKLMEARRRAIARIGVEEYAKLTTEGRRENRVKSWTSWLKNLPPEEWTKEVAAASRGPLWEFNPQTANAWMATIGSQTPILAATMAGRAVGKVTGGLIGGPKGAVVGGIAGGFAPMALGEAGDFYDAGQALGLDDDILRKYAKGYGAGSGAIEYAQMAWILRAAKGKPLVGTVKAVAIKVLKEVCGIVWEGGEEFTQNILQNWLLKKAVAEHNARHPEAPIKAPTIGEGGLRAFTVGAGVSAALRLPGHAVGFGRAAAPEAVVPPVVAPEALVPVKPAPTAPTAPLVPERYAGAPVAGIRRTGLAPAAAPGKVVSEAAPPKVTPPVTEPAPEAPPAKPEAPPVAAKPPAKAPVAKPAQKLADSPVIKTALTKRNTSIRPKYHKGHLDEAIAAAIRLKKDAPVYVFGTYSGYTIAPQKPPGTQRYIEVQPSGRFAIYEPTIAKPPVAKPAEAKQPWEMTKSEYVKSLDKIHKDSGLDVDFELMDTRKDRPHASEVKDMFRGKPGVEQIKNERHPNEPVWVYRNKQGEPVGTLRITLSRKGTPLLADIVVEEEYVRKGIATELVEAARKDGIDVDRALDRSPLTREGAFFNHSRAVQLAAQQGKTIPAEVLREYKGEKWADAALAKLEKLKAKKAEIPKLDTFPAGAAMGGWKYTSGLQYKRLKALEKLQEAGHGHVIIGKQKLPIATAIKKAKLAIGVMPLERMRQAEAAPIESRVLDKDYNTALKKLNDSKIFGGTPLSAEQKKDAGIVGLYQYEAGAQRFGDWKKKMEGLVGKNIRLHLPTVWKHIKAGRQRFREIQKAVPKAALPSEVKKRLRAKVQRRVMTANQLLRTVMNRLEVVSPKIYMQAARDIVAEHAEIAQYAKERLADVKMTENDRTRIMKAVASARTKAERHAAIATVEIVAEHSQRRQAIAEFRQAKKKLRERLRPEYREKADALLDTITDTTPANKTLAKAESLMKHLEVADDPDVPEPIIKRAQDALRRHGAIPLKKLDPDTIRSITNFLEHVVHRSAVKNKLLYSRRYRQKQEAYTKATSEVVTRHPKLKVGAPGEFEDRRIRSKLFDVATWDQLSLDTKAFILGGEGSAVEELLFNSPMRGETERLELYNSIMDKARVKVERLGIDLTKESSAANRPPGFIRRKLLRQKTRVALAKVKLPRAHTDIGERVETIELTQAEIGSVLNHRRDSQTRRELNRRAHLGITLARPGARAIKLYREDFEAIEAAASAKTQEMSKHLYDLVNGPIRDAGNAAWVEEKGVEIFRRNDHWSRRRSNDYSGTDPDKIMLYWVERQLDQQGIFKPREPVNHPIVIGDMYAEFHSHLNRVAAYTGKQRATLDAMGLLRDTEFRLGVKRQLKRGANILADIEKTIKRYRGMEISTDESYERWLRGIVSRGHIGILGARPHIALYQVLSLINASAAGLPTKDVFRFWNWRTPLGKDTEKIFKHSPQLRARWEATGHQILTPQYAGPNLITFYTGKQQAWRDKAMALIKALDEIAIVNIWRAAELEVKRTSPDLKDDAFYEAVARRTEEVVWRSQPTWDVLTQSSLARVAKEKLWTRLATLFSSQRNKNLNMRVRAYSEWAHSEKTSKNHRKLIRVQGLVALQTALVAAVGAGWWRLLRGKEDDDEKRRTMRDGLLGYAFGFSQRLVGEWLIVGDAILASIMRFAQQEIEGKPTFMIERRHNLLVQAGDDAWEAMKSAWKAIAKSATEEKYKSGPQKGQLKWPNHAAQSVRSGMRFGSIVAGLPIQLPMRLLWQRWWSYKKDQPGYKAYVAKRKANRVKRACSAKLGEVEWREKFKDLRTRRVDLPQAEELLRQSYWVYRQPPTTDAGTKRRLDAHDRAIGQLRRRWKLTEK